MNESFPQSAIEKESEINIYLNKINEILDCYSFVIIFNNNIYVE